MDHIKERIRAASSIQHKVVFYEDTVGNDPPALIAYAAPFALPTPVAGDWVHAIDAPGAKPTEHWKAVKVEHNIGVHGGAFVWTTSVRVTRMSFE
ncbi:MAG: hypothetical protein U1E39_09440 [Planctomycetota bacterium]